MAAVPPSRAGRPRCGVLSRVDSFGYRRSLRPCLGTAIAPRRRAPTRQTLLASIPSGVARKRNPARLVIALSVAAVLAVFLLYTSIAGGGTPSLAPSELAGKTGVVTLVGVVQPGYRGDEYGSGLRFTLRDRAGGRGDGPRRLQGLEIRPVPRRPRGLGQGRAPQRHLRRGEGLARDEVPVEVHGQERHLSARARPRRARRNAGARRLRRRRRRLRRLEGAPPARALGAERARGCVRDEPRRIARARRRPDPERLLVRLRRPAHEPRAADRLHDLRVLGRPGGVAAALAPDPDRLLDRRPAREPPPSARPRRLGDARARRGHRLLRLPARRGRDPVRDSGGAARRERPQSEPAEPVHDGAPAAALPRLRRAHGAVRVRDGGAARAPHGRALDRRHTPLDARRVDGARRGTATGRALGLRGGRLGRLLRLGPRRERGADALARRDRVSRTP